MGPDEARRRIIEELSKGEYRTGQSFISWLLTVLRLLLASLVEGISGNAAAGPGSVVIVLVLALLVALALARRTGRIRRSSRAAVEAALDADPTLPAAELLTRARTARDEGRTDAAVILAVRSLVRDLEVRTLLDVSDGMTAHEAADGAARAFGDLRARLMRAADDFDAAAYSLRTTTAKQAEDAVRLAEFVAQSSPDPAALAGIGTGGRP